MRDDHEKFTAAGATIVAVARHTPEQMREYWTENKLPYIGVPDLKAELGELYKQQWKALKLGLMPAMFVVDAKGKIAFAHYSKGMSDIPSNQTVLKTIAGLAE